MLQTILKMISDNNRLRIINLVKDKPLCVGEIQTILGTTQSNTSRHLEKLKSNNLIDCFKDAQRVFYFLDKNLIKQYSFFYDLIYKDVLNEEQLNVDIKRLLKYRASGLTCEDLRAINFDFDKIQ